MVLPAGLRVIHAAVLTSADDLLLPATEGEGSISVLPGVSITGESIAVMCVYHEEGYLV